MNVQHATLQLPLLPLASSCQLPLSLICLPPLSVCLSLCLLSAATQILLKFLVRFSVKLIFIRLLGHNQIAEACTLNSKKHQRYLFVHSTQSLPLSLCVCVCVFNLISGANASAIQIPKPCNGYGLLFFFGKHSGGKWVQGGGKELPPCRMQVTFSIANQRTIEAALI